MSSRRRALRKRKLYDEAFAVVAARDGMTCRWCGCAVARVPNGFGGRLADDAATLDHHPVKLCDGGPDTPENLVMACAPCNNSRGSASGSAGPITEAELVALMGEVRKVARHVDMFTPTESFAPTGEGARGASPAMIVRTS